MELKSELDVDKLGAYAEKIVASGWEREYLVVGATLFDAPAGYLRDFDFAQVWLGTIGIKGEDSGPAALHIAVEQTNTLLLIRGTIISVADVETIKTLKT